MKVATIFQTKNQLSSLLDRVRHGESILIVDRNRPVARLEPVVSGEEGDQDGRLARLERAGLLQRGQDSTTRRKRILDEPPSKPKKGGDVLKAAAFGTGGRALKYWDSSAIVPLLVQQAASTQMKTVFSKDPVLIVWWGTKVECDSAIARMEREEQLTESATGEALSRLDDMATLWHEIQPVDVLRETARRVLRLHNLRAADALQLAAAALAAENRASTLEFVCLDERLARAATREGFVLVDG